MRLKARPHFIFSLLCLSFLALSYLNCSVPNSKVSFEEFKTNLSTHQNGDGYLGKPPPGEFVRTHLNYQCLGSVSQKPNLQGYLNVDLTGATVTEDNCQDFNYSVTWSDARLDGIPYNPDFIGLNAAIYERSTSAAQDPGQAVETFCRLADANQGLDIIAKINSGLDAKVKIYSGTQNSGSWTSRVIPSFPVQRASQGATKVSYSADGFSLSVDLSNANEIFFPARLIAQIDGKKIEQTVSCRHMRKESAINFTPNGLIGLWQFNQNFLDLSGLGNHITPIDPNGTMTFQTGVYKQSVQLDGTTHRLQVAPSQSLNNLQRLSVSAWVWPADNGQGRTHGGIVHKSDKAAGITQGWQFHIGADTLALGFEAAFAGGNLYLNAGGGMVANKWNHLAVTWDGSPNETGVKMYINGVEAQVGAFVRGIGARVDDSSLPLYLGDWTDYPAFLKGQMDQTSLWNRILTPEEIRNLYLSGSPNP